MSARTIKKLKFYNKVVMDIAEIDDFMIDNDFIATDGRVMWEEAAKLISDKQGNIGISRQLLHGHAQKKAFIARYTGLLRIIPNNLILELEEGVNS